MTGMCEHCGECPCLCPALGAVAEPHDEERRCSDCGDRPCSCPTLSDYEQATGRIAELEEDLEDLQANYEVRSAELADVAARLADRERQIVDLERKLDLAIVAAASAIDETLFGRAAAERTGS